MKTIIFVLGLLLSPAFSNALLAQTETTLHVDGNCDMCKKRIEQALDIPGVKLAKWDPNSHKLKVRFDEKKINLDQIREYILAVGHDVDGLKAEEEVYQKLHTCCKYERHH